VLPLTPEVAVFDVDDPQVDEDDNVQEFRRRLADLCRR
jgi:hypothetical protein